MTYSTTVTLPKPTVGRRSASKILENRATSADYRPISAPILAEFLVGRCIFCRSTQVKSFVDRSADFHGFCHQWSVGRWSPDDRPIVGRRFEEIYIMKSAEGRPIIGRQSADERQTVGQWCFIKESSADRRRYRPSFGRWSPDCRSIIKCDLCYIFYNACIHIMYEIKPYINVILGFSSLDVVYKYHLFCCCWISNWTTRMTFWNYVSTSPKKIET